MRRPTLSILPLLTGKHIERFWSKVDKRGPDDCWPFVGARGYGAFVIGRRGITASRVAWTLRNQEELGDRLACHSCDNRWCCNPAHIWPGTHADNNRDTVSKRRHHTQNRPQKNGIRSSLALDRELLKRLDKWIAGQDVPPSKTAVHEAALREFLDKRERNDGRKYRRHGRWS